jgi:uncharacterized OsmC-like protein
VLSLFAARNQIPLQGAEFEVIKEMSASPRKIKRLTMSYTLHTACSEEDLAKLIHAAKTCPVRLSLEPSIEIIEVYHRQKP